MSDTGTFSIGDPVRLSNGILGHITSIDGGTFMVRTPHGSTFKSGFCWVSKLDKDESRRLGELQADALSRPRRMNEVYR